MKHKLIVIPLAVLAVLAFLAEAVFVLTPVEVIEGKAAEMARSRAGLIITAGSMRRLFPLGYEALDIRVRAGGAEGSSAASKQGPHLEAAALRAVLSLPSLLALSPAFVLSGRVLGGELRGKAWPRPGSLRLRIAMSGVQVPLPEPLSVLEPGPLDIDIDIVYRKKSGCAEGEARIRGREGLVREFYLPGFRVPGAAVTDEGMDLRLKDCRIYIRSAWLRSAAYDISARGVAAMTPPLSAAPVTLRVELLPKGGLIGGLGRIDALRPYRMGPGMYRAVLRGTPGSLRPTPE